MLIKTNILLIALFVLSIYTVSFADLHENAIANNENGSKYYPSNTSLNNPFTAIIWGFSTGMLGICVPLTAIAKSGAILPLAVIL